MGLHRGKPPHGAGLAGSELKIALPGNLREAWLSCYFPEKIFAPEDVM